MWWIWFSLTFAKKFVMQLHVAILNIDGDSSLAFVNCWIVTKLSVRIWYSSIPNNCRIFSKCSMPSNKPLISNRGVDKGGFEVLFWGFILLLPDTNPVTIFPLFSNARMSTCHDRAISEASVDRIKSLFIIFFCFYLISKKISWKFPCWGSF